MSFKLPFQRKASAIKKLSREESLKSALDSTNALESAAKGTMTLAADLAETLQAKIDDYTKLVEQTAKLLHDALLVVDTNGIIDDFNPAAEEMFGWRRRSILGKKIDTIFAFDGTPSIDPSFMEKFKEEVNQDDTHHAVNYEAFKGVRQDGTSLFVDVSASKLTRSDNKTIYLILVRDVTSRVNSHLELVKLAVKNQELLQTINASNTGFMILSQKDKDYKVDFINDGFAKLVNICPGNSDDLKLQDLVGVSSEFWEIRRTLSDMVENSHEVLLGTEDNKIWFNVHITPVFKNGSVHQWILVFYNTSELKKAYNDLRESVTHFRAFSDASSESMFVHDAEELLDWNDRLLDLTGYSESELSKLSPLDFVHPLERESIRARLQSNESEGYETLFTTKQGTVLEITVNSRPIEWENAEAQIVVARDVTAFKDIDTQLKSARERYKTVIDNTIDLVICFNSNFEITFSNQTFRDYYDVELEDINGFSLLEIIPESDHEKFKEYMLGICPEIEVQRGTHRVNLHNEVRWQDWIDRGIFDEEGNLIEIQSVARDITHLMKDQ